MVRQTNVPWKCTMVVVGLARPYQFVSVSCPFTFARQSQIELGPRGDPLREPAITGREKTALLALEPKAVESVSPVRPPRCAIHFLDDLVDYGEQLPAKMLSTIPAS